MNILSRAAAGGRAARTIYASPDIGHSEERPRGMENDCLTTKSSRFHGMD
jgi:hypothetical protein